MYSTKIAGLLSFAGACQFLIIMLICEAIYPGYSISKNMISDLGIGHTAGLFNSSIILLGMMIILSAISFHSFHRNRIFTILMILTGAGAMGVGIFPENIKPYHEICAGITFLFGGLSETLSVFLIRFPMSIAAAFLGGLTLGCLALFVLGNDLGLGSGGMERMIVYPVILWGAGFGGYLMASERR
ncbi:MAG: hypothetical protein A4E49_02494 [Methanosaeta sp. PtaU1.Bin112]|nr:MAG: hypothetical protein A4E49_02494 [Methanosaeta sp. PtaU1.Bin112]